MLNGRFGGPATTLVALAATGIVAAAALLVGGHDPAVALRALVSGAFGSPQQVQATLVRSVPLILTGLAVAVAFRTGVWNIGAEGQLYAGAIVGVWVALSSGSLPTVVAVPLSLFAAGVAGAVWAAVPALMKLRLGVGEVITTILMNFVGIHFASYVVRGPLQESRAVFPRTDEIAEAVRIPVLWEGGRLHAGFLLAVVLCLGLWVFFRHTATGFHWRAVGASPRAAEVSGRIDPGKAMLVAFVLSGVLAGLAGGVEVGGRTFAFYEGLSPGWGYTAIAVALLAGLNPLAVFLTGIFFGALEAGAGAMQRDAGIPSVWVDGIEALVILAVLAVDRPFRRAAALRIAEGRPLADGEITEPTGA